MYGGELVTTNQDYPWVVLILTQITRTYVKVCSGTAIAQNWVLTAAHCLDGGHEPVNADLVTVNTLVEKNHFVKYPVHSTYQHPLFGEGGSKESNDLGLIRTSVDMDVEIALLRESPDYPNVSCILIGYGLQKAGNTRDGAPTLAKLRVNLLPQSTCQDKPQDRLICLIAAKGKGPCIGDSGSPMICGDQVAGVCSRGVFPTPNMNCGMFDLAVILYEMVDLDWINETMRKYSSAESVRTTGVIVSLTVFAWLMMKRP